ncbi:class I tRNA ligase family protein [Streptomyces montanisoli]|uniref:Methionyl-tRNA synthetase n=1 Tax=Streptomyces montanisoli TaxID=2798581 RepID=A0A940RXK7_9ACTN|nr:class I tRNA ligase family protein [Streptomyces montanisoli]MBP0460431.1 class I tRNA ligase family protein [Streptomyces montanisoli]
MSENQRNTETSSTVAHHIVTSAPPNPNGDLHLGHLSGPFLGADVLTRHLRQRGGNVSYVGYSDEHSCYVPRRAAELGSTAHRTALTFGSRMEETLALGAMHHDWFTRPLTTPRHDEIVQRFFTGLWEQGRLEVRTLPVFWCAHCERELYEAEVRGECQFCGAASDGVYCEACGLPQEPAALAAPRCTACRQTPEVRELERVCFPLGQYRDRLLAYYERAQQSAEWRPRLRAYLETLFSRELPLTPISRRAAYGIPVPLDGWDGHILDTWFSGIFGYVAATACLTSARGEPDAWERLWSDPETRIVNFIGFDCSFSHAVLWPALLMAHGGMTLPSQVVINEFYRLEGDKFSTSRDHAVWGGEFLRRVSADALRFHLCLTGPEREQTNFAAKEFAATVETVLIQGVELWTRTVLAAVAADFGGAVPAGVPTAADGPAAALPQELAEALAGSLGAAAFSPQAAASALAASIAAAVADLPELARLRGTGEAYARRVGAHVEALATVAVTAAAIMPGWSEYLAGHLNVPIDRATRMPAWPAGAARLVAPGTALPATLPAFFHDVS